MRFYLGEQLRIVEEVVGQWYGPNHTFFRVRADDGNLYILRQSTSQSEQEWTLDSFRDLNES